MIRDKSGGHVGSHQVGVRECRPESCMGTELEVPGAI